MSKGGYVYILCSKKNGVLYTGVTADLATRLEQHRSGQGSGFAGRYFVRHLVWYEWFDVIEDAIAREKQIKAGSRADKIALIEGRNAEWRDLSEDEGFLQ